MALLHCSNLSEWLTEFEGSKCWTARFSQSSTSTWSLVMRIIFLWNMSDASSLPFTNRSPLDHLDIPSTWNLMERPDEQVKNEPWQVPLLVDRTQYPRISYCILIWIQYSSHFTYKLVLIFHLNWTLGYFAFKVAQIFWIV